MTFSLKCHQRKKRLNKMSFPWQKCGPRGLCRTRPWGSQALGFATPQWQSCGTFCQQHPSPRKRARRAIPQKGSGRNLSSSAPWRPGGVSGPKKMVCFSPGKVGRHTELPMTAGLGSVSCVVSCPPYPAQPHLP